MRTEIVNLICNECGRLITIPELIRKNKCYFCDSINIEKGYNIKND